MNRFRIDKLFHTVTIAVLVVAAPSISSKRVVNPDGGADYTILDSALSAINRSAITVDTLLIDGADQRDTLTWSFDMTRENYPSLVVRSTANNPDSFPALRRSGNLGWNFLENTNLAFENFLFRNATANGREFAWTNAQSTGKTHRFKNCIIKDQSGKYFFGIEGSNSTTMLFENCLFENNATIFFVQFWSGTPTVTFTNCTFDNNTQIFNSDFSSGSATNISLKNCIFSGNTSTFPSGGVLKGKTTNSLTSEALTGYGTGCFSNTNPRYKSSSRNIPSDWLITYSSANPSPAINIGTSTGAPASDISGYSRLGNPDAGCWEVHMYTFTWDASATSGIQSGGGTWGDASASDYWTYDGGTTRTSWRGAGNSATFAGSDGSHSVTVSGTQYVDSLTFTSGTYTLTGGSLTFTGNNYVDVASGKTAVISSVIAGSIGLNKTGTGTLLLSGPNTYTGGTTINSGTISINNLDDGSGACGIGASDNAAASLIINGGELAYTGPARRCDRLFSAGTNGATITSSGTGALELNNSGAVGFSGAGARTITLSGAGNVQNTLAAVIGDSGGATSIVKNGSGTWVLSGTHTYTGATTISAGCLYITGSTTGSTTTVASGATLGGTGSIGGSTVINGTFAPGMSGTGILTVNGNVNFGNAGSYGVTLSGITAGALYDQLVVNGTVTCTNSTLLLSLAYNPVPGHSYFIIDNDGTDAATGTFSGCPEGGRLILSYGGTSYYYTISYHGGTGNDVVVTAVSVATDYFWDLAPAAGFQPGNGTWGTDNFWSADGSTLTGWLGAGNTATFGGSDGAWTISVNGVQNVDSLTFNNGTYTLSGGVINLGTGHGILVAPGKTAVISSIINGTGGLSKFSSGTLTLTGTNTFAGNTSITGGTLQLGNGGETGSINGDVVNSGTLTFNRSNLYIFPWAISGAGTVTKAGTGTLKLTGNHAYTGMTSISGGTLVVNGAIASGSSVTMAAGALLGGTGACNGTVVADGAAIAPGDGGSGKLTTGPLSLSGTSVLNLDLGAASDTIDVHGNLTLDGTINITPLAGFASDTFTVLTSTGTITDNRLAFGSVPAGRGYAAILTDHSVAIVCTTALFTAEPGDTSVVLGKSCSFTSGASGVGRLSYTWIKAPSTVVGTTPTLTFTVDSINDSGSYRCIVADSFGIDTSRWATLSIIVPPKITVQPVPDTVFAGNITVFRLTAAGTAPLTFTWYKAGTGADSLQTGSGDSLRFTSASFSDSGWYYCIIGNAGGADTSDTVHLVVKHIPPSAATIRPDSIEVFSGDTASFRVNVTGTPPFSCSWYKVLPGADSLIRNAAISDSIIFSTVALSDSGSYYCTVGNPGGIDTSDTARLIVRHVPPYGTDISSDSTSVFLNGTAVFTVTAHGTAPFTYAWYKALDADDSLLAATGDTLRISNAVFADSGAYYCIVANPGGKDTTDTAILAVSNFPPSAADINPDSATAVAGDTARFLVTASGTRLFTYAWYKVHDGHDSLMPTSSDTLRFAGASIIDSGQYYCIVGNTGGADTSDTVRFYVTPKIPDSPPNPIVIDTAYFDTLAGTIRLSWCVDSAALASDAQAAISYGFSPAAAADTAAPYQPVTLLSRCSDAILRLSEPVRFDTTYYLSLRLRTAAGILISPTDSSRTSLRTGHPSRQSVTLFDSTVKRDTIAVFNGSVFLWKDSSYTDKASVIDTLSVVSIPTPPPGMIVVGTALRFKKAAPSLPFFVGFAIHSLPPERTIDEVRIYNDSAGSFLVDYATVIDTANDIVYVRTANLDRAFFAMIDTVLPVVAVFSDTAACAASTAALTDSLRINDNVANVRWKYFYGSGDKVPLLREENTTYRTGRTIRLSISDTSHVISSESGLRAYLVISDGIHLDTIDFSRSVIRYESDKQTTEADIWMPVCPTAQLKTTSGRSLIARLPLPNASGYDDRYLRLFRWVDYAGNHTASDKWIEYNPESNDISDLFTLAPGRMMWLKTRGNTPFHLDTGYTLSLKEPFSIELPAGQWTDFGMPYRFGVRIAEILSASGSGADSVQFYRWKRDSATTTYELEPWYVPGMPDHFDRSATIDHLPGGGYSIFNTSSKTVTLRIPPTLPSMAKRLARTGKRAGSASWSIKFIAREKSGHQLPPVYFGYAAGMKKSIYPLAHSFATLRAWVFDRKTAMRYGHAIGEDAAGGLVRELQLSNSSDAPRMVQFHLETAGTLPEGYRAFCYDAASQRSDSSGSVTIDPKSTASRWIIAGDAAYRENFLAAIAPLKFMLHSLYPNPARSLVTIRYTVPFGSQERIRIAIYNVLGKKVWEKRIDGLLTEGNHTVTWNGCDRSANQAGSGMYIVRLTVNDIHGKPVRQFDRQVTLLR